jgi:regulator of protease activity HflC (stomatin/prohibitin superfamily)
MFALRINEIMNRLIKALVVLVVLCSGVALIAASYYFAPVIKATERGVVMTGDAAAGKNMTVLAPGKHYWFISGYNPISNTLVRVEIKEQELNLTGSDDSESAAVVLTTKDDDSVMAEFKAWYRIIPEQAGVYLAASGDGDITKIIKEITIATAQDESALYDAEVLYKAGIRTEYITTVKNKINQQLASRGVELTVFNCDKFTFSKELLQKMDEIKQARLVVEVNKIRVQSAKVAAQVTEEVARGKKKAALQEAEARKESVIMASEAQVVAATNWVAAEKIKAEVLLVRSKAKAEALQIEAAAKVFSGTEGERFLRYRIADSLADAWAQRNNMNLSNSGEKLELDGLAAGIKSLSTPTDEGAVTK